MPIDRVRNDGTVFRKKLNGIRPHPTGGGGALVIATAQTLNPGKLVVGAAAAMRNAYLLAVKPAFQNPETFETLPVGPNWDAQVMSSNGNTSAVFTGAGAGEISNDTFANQWNTTPAGANFGLTDDAGPLRFTFGALLSGFACFFTDMGDFGTHWSVTLTDEHAISTVYAIPHATGLAAEGNLVFWGFYDGSGLRYTKVEITGDAVNGDAIGCDDIYLLTLAQLV